MLDERHQQQDIFKLGKCHQNIKWKTWTTR
jgi:hypothetical protein